MSNFRVADYLHDTREVSNMGLSPLEQLVAAIFMRAFLDCRNKRYWHDIRSFAKSEWCTALLCGGVDPDFVSEQFDAIINLYGGH